MYAQAYHFTLLLLADYTAVKVTRTQLTPWDLSYFDGRILVRAGERSHGSKYALPYMGFAYHFLYSNEIIVLC